MPRRKSPDNPIKPERLTGTERRAAKVDAWVKDHLAKERAAQAIKREELKALRAGKDKS
jgi:hypothetical protein